MYIKGYNNRYFISQDGSILNTKSGRRLNPYLQSVYKNHKRYIVVGLTKDSKTKTYKLHRLLAEAFIENPDKLLEIDHIDGNPVNNQLSNLRWCTRTQNNGNKRKIKQTKYSKYKGIKWQADIKKWVVRIAHEHIGVYVDEKDAAKVYNSEAIKRYGGFASLNEV